MCLHLSARTTQVDFVGGVNTFSSGGGTWRMCEDLLKMPSHSNIQICRWNNTTFIKVEFEKFCVSSYVLSFFYNNASLRPSSKIGYILGNVSIKLCLFPSQNRHSWAHGSIHFRNQCKFLWEQMLKFPCVGTALFLCRFRHFFETCL